MFKLNPKIVKALISEIREVIDHSKDPQTLGSTVGSWFEDAFSSYGGVCKVTFKIDLK